MHRKKQKSEFLRLQRNWNIKYGHRKNAKKLKIGVFYSYSPEEELEDPYYLCIRLALERKLEEEGYLRQTVKMEDTAESLSGLDGVISTGTFTGDMIAVIELWGNVRLYLWTQIRIRRNLTVLWRITARQ